MRRPVIQLFSTLRICSCKATYQSPLLPDTFGANQIKNKTLFTLAIHLIELGRNESFSSLRQRCNEALDKSPTGPTRTHLEPKIIDDFKLADMQIRHLCLDPGRTYANATHRCLSFMFPGPVEMNTFEHSSFRKTFFDEVVAPVQATFELVHG